MTQATAGASGVVVMTRTNDPCQPVTKEQIRHLTLITGMEPLETIRQNGEFVVKRIRILAGLAMAGTVIAGSAAGAFAGVGLHWYQGQTPTVNLSGNTVTATGKVGGAGTYITAVLTVNYTYPVSCFNPGNDTGPVPGQSQNGSATTAPQIDQANHGNASFSLSETVPTPTAPANACPNSSWTGTAGPLTITSATVGVTSNNGGSLTYTKVF